MSDNVFGHSDEVFGKDFPTEKKKTVVFQKFDRLLEQDEYGETATMGEKEFSQKYPATPLPPGMLATPDGALPRGEGITRPMFYMKIALVELHCLYCKQKLYRPVILRSSRANPWFPDTFEVLTIILSKVEDFSHMNGINPSSNYKVRASSYPCEGQFKAMRIWSEARIDDVRRSEFEGEYIRGSGEAIVPVIDV